jgi:hypothetical protein
VTIHDSYMNVSKSISIFDWRTYGASRRCSNIELRRKGIDPPSKTAPNHYQKCIDLHREDIKLQIQCLSIEQQKCRKILKIGGAC